MNKLREIDNNDFPYISSKITYIEIQNKDIIKFACAHRKCDLKSLLDSIERAKNNESIIIASWAGNYRTDIFEVKDLNKLKEKIIEYL